MLNSSVNQNTASVDLFYVTDKICYLETGSVLKPELWLGQQSMAFQAKGLLEKKFFQRSFPFSFNLARCNISNIAVCVLDMLTILLQHLLEVCKDEITGV